MSLGARQLIFVVPPSAYSRAMGRDPSVCAPFEGTASVVTAVGRLRAGFSIRCYDLRACREGRAALSEAVSADCVCLAGSPDGYAFVKGFARQIRKIERQRGMRRVPIVLGGPLATISWATVLEKTEVDYCVLGEAEHSLPSLLQCLDEAAEPRNLPVAWRAQNGEVTRGSGIIAEWVPDMATVPCPDYTPWRVSHRDRMADTVCYSTQRGCPFECRFCANPNGRRTRMAPLEKVEWDLRDLKRQGFRSICINDPTFNTNPDRCVKIAQILKKLGLPWICLVRAKPTSEALLRTFRQCGCTTLGVGVESATEAILDGAVKGITPADVSHCLRHAEAASLSVVGFCILGLPGETFHTLERLKRFSDVHSFTPRAFFAVPFPGTDLYERFRLATKLAMQSNADFEEHVLLRMARLRHDGWDNPFELPDRTVSRQHLVDCMRWMLARSGPPSSAFTDRTALTQTAAFAPACR